MADASRVLSRAMFQSSPTPRGGRYIGPYRERSFPLRFNPRPPLEVGATVPLGGHSLGVGRFNPRPPLEVGATTQLLEGQPFANGFNPRPPLEVGATARAFADG